LKFSRIDDLMGERDCLEPREKAALWRAGSAHSTCAVGKKKHWPKKIGMQPAPRECQTQEHFQYERELVRNARAVSAREWKASTSGATESTGLR
jgi:hypothetical protein